MPFRCGIRLVVRITDLLPTGTHDTNAGPSFHIPQDPFSPLISWGSFSLELPKVSTLSGGSSPTVGSPMYREDSVGAQPPPAPPPSGSGSRRSLPLWLWVVIAISVVLAATGCVVLAGAVRRRHILRKRDVARRHARMQGRTVVTAPEANDPVAGVMGLVGDSGSGTAGAAAVGALDEAATEVRLLRRSVTAGVALGSPEAAAQVFQLRRSATGVSVLRLEDVELSMGGESGAACAGGSRAAAGSGPTSPLGPSATSPASLERRGWGMGTTFKAAPNAGAFASPGGVDEISPASSLHSTMLATDMQLAAQEEEHAGEQEQRQGTAGGASPTGAGGAAAAKAGTSPHELQLPGSTEDVGGVRTLPLGAGVVAAFIARGGVASGRSFHSPPPPQQQQQPTRAFSSALRLSKRDRRASLPTSLASAVQDADGTERQLSDPAGLTAASSGKSNRWPSLKAAHFSDDGTDVGLSANGVALGVGRGSSTRWPSLAARVSTNGKAASPSADSAGASTEGRGGAGSVMQAAAVRPPPRRVLTSIGSGVLREQKSAARRASTLGFSMDGREKLLVAAGRASVPGLGGTATAAASASQTGVDDSPFRSSASVAWDDPLLAPVPHADPGGGASGGGGAGMGQFVRMTTGDLQYQQPPAAPRPRRRTLAALMHEQQLPAGGSPSRRQPMSRPTSMLSVSTSAPFTPMPRSPGDSNSPRANTNSRSTDGTRAVQPPYGKAAAVQLPYTAEVPGDLDLLDVLGSPRAARAPVIPATGGTAGAAGETPSRFLLSPGSTPSHISTSWGHSVGTAENVPRALYRAGPLSPAGSSRRQPPPRLLLPPDSSRTYPTSPAAASAPLPTPSSARTPSRTANGYNPAASYPSSPRAGAIILSPEAADAAQAASGSTAASANTRFRRSSSSALPVVMHENPLARPTGRPSSLAVRPVVVESGSQQGQQHSPPQPLRAPGHGDGGSARGQLSERAMRVEGLSEAGVSSRPRAARSLFTGVVRRSMAGTGAGTGAVKP